MDLKGIFISADKILDRIKMYETRLEEAKNLSDTKLRFMRMALLGVKMIVGDLVIEKNNGWISVKDSLPDPLETVFISNGKGWTSIGCRTDLLDDGEGGYTWCWAEANGIIYQEEGKLVAECECEDLDVLYWHKLPLPPKY